jgi:hypothetical protein
MTDIESAPSTASDLKNGHSTIIADINLKYRDPAIFDDWHSMNRQAVTEALAVSCSTYSAPPESLERHHT